MKQKTAVMYGAGNIGRGFIGALLSQAGYKVIFVDIADSVVDRLIQKHSYPVRIVTNEGHEDIEITNVDAVHGQDQEAVADVIASADIMATAVGASVLKYIVPNLAAGFKKRFLSGAKPLNVIICENLLNADTILENMLLSEFSPDEQRRFKQSVGLVEASIGRMVPVQTPQMKGDEPLRVCVEKYGFLPVDQAAFKGDIPDIKNMIPYEPFDFYLKRKLYIHNMGHAVCAYLGQYFNYNYIYETIENADIQLIVHHAMLESAQALSSQYNVALDTIIRHIDDLVFRFHNQALQDTCGRVGADPKRKLKPDDRLIGAAMMCLDQGVVPAYICAGIGSAIYAYIAEYRMAQTTDQAAVILSQASGLRQDGSQHEQILFRAAIDVYKLILQGTDAAALRKQAMLMTAAYAGDIV